MKQLLLPFVVVVPMLASFPALATDEADYAFCSAIPEVNVPADWVSRCEEFYAGSKCFNYRRAQAVAANVAPTALSLQRMCEAGKKRVKELK